MSRRLTRRTWAALAILLLAIPALMAVFVCVWDERKYYLTSLLLVGLMFVPFVLRFEGRRPQARELVLLATMTALAVAGRAAFYWLPQCKPVCAIVILTAVAFTPEAGFVTGAAAGLISNFFFGQGPWTPWQMLGFGLVGFVGGVLFSGRRVRLVPLLIYGFLSVFVLYGVVATAVGIVFEPPLSLIVNAVGSVICISVPYFTGRASGGEAAHKLLAKYKKLGEVYEGNRDNLFLVSLVLRVTNLSNDILGLFFGALRMDYWQYLASSFIGILPTMVLYTVLGSDLDLTSTPVLICAGVDIACIIAAWFVLRHRKKRKGTQNEEKAL